MIRPTTANSLQTRDTYSAYPESARASLYLQSGEFGMCSDAFCTDDICEKN